MQVVVVFYCDLVEAPIIYKGVEAKSFFTTKKNPAPVVRWKAV